MVFALVAFAPFRSATLSEQIGEVLKPIPSLHQEEYIFNPTAGKYKNQPAPALQMIAETPKHLHALGIPRWEWLKRTCDYFSTTGKDVGLTNADQVVLICNNSRVTKADVEEYAVSTLPPSMRVTPKA